MFKFENMCKIRLVSVSILKYHFKHTKISTNSTECGRFSLYFLDSKKGTKVTYWASLDQLLSALFKYCSVEQMRKVQLFQDCSDHFCLQKHEYSVVKYLLSAKKNVESGQCPGQVHSFKLGPKPELDNSVSVYLTPHV